MLPVPPVLLDGVTPDATMLSLLADPALWAGHAVFETMRTYGRVPFRLGVHLDRLEASARWVGIEPPSRAVIEAELATLAAAIPGESKLNVLLTAGGHRLVRGEPLDLSRVGRPVRVVTRVWAPPEWLPGRVKHTSRAAWLVAARGADEVVFEAPDGTWTEANRSNLFVVRAGELWTAPDDGRILQGVTRDGLLEAARAEGVPVREEPVVVGPFDEMYLCSTLKELAPVVEIDGRPAPGWGPVGRALLAAFQRRFPEVGG